MGGVFGISSGATLWYAATEITGTTIMEAACILGMGATGAICIAAGLCLAGYGIYQLVN